MRVKTTKLFQRRKRS